MGLTIKKKKKKKNRKTAVLGIPELVVHEFRMAVQTALAEFYKNTQILWFINFQMSLKRAPYMKQTPRYSHLRKYSYSDLYRKIISNVLHTVVSCPVIWLKSIAVTFRVYEEALTESKTLVTPGYLLLKNTNKMLT